MNPLVPKDVEHYARAVLDIPDDEYILAAMRTSFTQFHRGIVIGRDAIYWRNDHKVITSVNKLTWNELSQQKEQFRARRRTVELGNGAIFDNIGSLNKTSIIINLLDLLIDRYQSQNSPAEGFIFDEKEMVELVRSIPNNKEELKKQCAESAADAETVSFLSILGSIFKKIIGR